MISFVAAIILGIVLVIIGYFVQRYSKDGIIKSMGNAIWIIGIIILIVGIALIFV